MPRRPWMLPPVALLLACLVVVPACKKKPPADGDPPAPAPGPGPAAPPAVVPAAVSSEHVLYAHLRVKDIRDSAIFNEVKQALTKEGLSDLWNKFEEVKSDELGCKPMDLDSVTLCVTDLPPREDPKSVLILTSSKPFEKAKTFRVGKDTKPDSRGLYKRGRDWLVHYPDDKTAVLLHPDLAQKYLDGYAKDRAAWPLTADLVKAATGRTLLTVLNLQKVPNDVKTSPEFKNFSPILKAQTVTLTADLNGKQLNVAGRATFPDAVSAENARGSIRHFIAVAAGEVEQVLNKKGPEADEFFSLTAVQPAIKEALRALNEAKVEVSGSEVTLTGSYKADFDITKLVADVAKKYKEVAPRWEAVNNFRQIGIALHNYASANLNQLPIHGVAVGSAPLKNATEKPLLSWRVAILPYIEQDPLYKQFKLDEPWDSEHNKKLIAKMPKVFASTTKPGKPGETHVQMIIGPSAMQPGISLVSIRDGTANTIAVVEAAEPVVWTKPDDVMFPGKELPKDFRKKFGGQFPNGFNAVMWDGSVRFIPNTVSDRTLQCAIDPKDGVPLGSDW